MDSIEKIIKNPDGFKKFPNWLVEKIIGSPNRMQMVVASWVFIFMLDRAELSLQQEWIDHTNNVYIYFTYAEVKKLLNCGTTTAWKIFKCLKKSGLISIKQQGFGLPNKIYVHTPDKKYENINTDKQNTENHSIEALKSKYPATFTELLSDCEIDRIISTISEKSPGASHAEVMNYARDIIDRFIKIKKKKSIDNPFGYIMSMLRNFRPTSKKCKPPNTDYSNKPSFDLDLIMEHSKNTPLIPLDN